MHKLEIGESSNVDQLTRDVESQLVIAPSSSTSNINTHFDEKLERAFIKHFVLEKYLGAWLPIMLISSNPTEKIIFVDGFAGPGKYLDGNDGSPIVGLKTLFAHKLRNKFKNKIQIIYIEIDEATAKHLITEVQNYLSTQEDSDWVSVQFITGEFQPEMERILDDPENKDAPLLVFGDPFGYKQMPMEILNKILQRPKAEVLVNVMDGFVRRFQGIQNRERAITTLVGSEDWKEIRDITDPEEWREEFIGIYKRNLLANKTLHFSMKNENNNHIYHLVFGTNHVKGREAMKRAMASASQDSELMYYSEFNSDIVPRMDIKSNDYKSNCALKTLNRLYELYNSESKVITGPEIDEFIWAQTPYVSNFKVMFKKELKMFETADKIEIIKNGRFEEIVIRFKPKA